MKLLNEILGTKYPIIQGGMANIATGEFAAACSNAGALGIIGAGGMNAETLRENIRRCKALTDKPFGVNIMLMHPQADEFAKIVVEEGVKVVTTGAGNPGKYVPMWKEAGIKVIPVVAAAVLAKHLAPLGVDAVIAEGTESGGHVGEMTTMALVPQVVDAVDVPVIAAGGIADGRQLAAAFALGACGVQVGTCLLVSEECPVHENYKAALLRAKDSDTIVTGRIGGTPVRVLKNRMSREYVRQEKAGADKMGENHALIHACEIDGLTTSSAGTHGMVDANLLVRVLKTPLMWVDASGRRFGNEEHIYDTVYWANVAYSVGGKYFTIVDASTLDAYTADKLPFEVSGAGPANPEGKGDFRVLMEEAVRQGVAFKGDTLEALAKNAGFSPAFVKEVADYNQAVRSGDDPFGKPREFLKFTVEKGPFYALRAKSREPLDARRRAR